LKKENKDGLLEAMFDPMIKVALKYKDLALKYEPILMATMLHPAWRLLLFYNKFPAHHNAAQSLLLKKYKDCQVLLKPPTPPTTKESPQRTDGADSEYIFYPINPGLDDSKDELNRYHEAKYTLGIQGNVLLWWKVRNVQIHFHLIFCVFQADCECLISNSESSTMKKQFSLDIK
jgi:hypothetical protein